MDDRLSDKAVSFLLAHGIDPFYFATVVMIIFSVSYYKELKNWKNVELSRKWLISSIVTAAVVFSFMSILSLLGIINL